MTLGEKQRLFVRLVADLIKFAYDSGYELTFGDAWARSGHMENSNHYIRLAIDLNLFKDGLYLTTTEAHESLGVYWKSLHPECRWGGDFKKKDGNHYSIIYQGTA